jgi:protein-disulfide isomerase
VVARLIEEARATVPDVRVEEVDVTEHPETAVKYGVMATPAIAINGRLEFVGVPGEEALRERLRSVRSA